MIPAPARCRNTSPQGKYRIVTDINPVDRQKRGNIRSLRHLLPFVRPYRVQVFAAGFALVIAAAMVLVMGQGLRGFIDHGFIDGNPDHLDEAGLAMAAIIGIMGFASAGRFYLVSWLGERVGADIRQAVFDRVLTLSPAYFETARTGEILSRLSTDTTVVQGVIGSAASQWTRNVLMLAGSLTMLVITSPKLALFVVAIVPIVLVPLLGFGRRERRLSREAQDRVADLGAYAEETLNAIRTVQAFTHEAVDRRNYQTEIERSVKTALRRVGTRSALLLVIVWLGLGAIAFGLWFGGKAVIAGTMTGGDLSAFVYYAILVASSGGTITELWGEMQRAAGAAERLVELLNEIPSIAVPSSPIPLARPVRGHIQFDDVTFRYPARPEQSALDRFSLTIEPGETVALVGPSGAGKSTVFQLLLRFYDPATGRVMIDGVDLTKAHPHDLRSALGLVPQDPVIFSANAWENIRYGNPDASDAAVRAAADAASATEFLDRLPQGFDTFLGEKGVRLSGGQRQRLAIARAILRDPPILLLDEATSALDAESERAVQTALAKLSIGRTTLVIAHRLATVRRADKIIVIDNGRIIATGRHESLLAEDGLYRRLAELQFTDA